jgi:hypothetical protein
MHLTNVDTFVAAFVTLSLAVGSGHIQAAQRESKPNPSAGPSGDSIRLVVNRSGGYEIEAAVRRQLEELAFRVVPPGAARYDGTLAIDYEETPCGDYTFGGKGTCIGCRAELRRPDGGLLLKEEFRASTSFVVRNLSLWSDAVQNFEANSGFALFGLNIARALENPLSAKRLRALRTKLLDKNWEVRFKTIGLAERSGARVADALMRSLRTEDNLWVVGRVAEALARNGDARAINSITERLARITDDGTREILENALKRLTGAR